MTRLIIPALRWAVRMGLEEETMALLSFQAFSRPEFIQRSLAIKNRIALRTAIQSHQHSILQRILEGSGFLSENEWNELITFSQLEGNRETLAMVSRALPRAISEPLERLGGLHLETLDPQSLISVC